MGIELRPFLEYSNIFITSGCEKEIRQLFNKSRSDFIHYLKWLDKRLLQLTDYPISYLINTGSFEPIVSGADKKFSLYCIRQNKGTANPRVLFSVLYDDKSNVYILLTAFSEKNKSDYNEPILAARRTMREIIKELEES